PEPLFHPHRVALRLRLLPRRLGGHAAHLVPRIRDRLETAILRVRAAGLERHDERLSRRVHHGVRDLETRLVDALENYDAYAHPCIGTRLAPGRLRRLDRGHQAVDVDLRIRDAEANAVRRTLGADLSDRRRLRQRKALVRELVERSLARLGGAFAINL